MSGGVPERSMLVHIFRKDSTSSALMQPVSMAFQCL